MSVPDPLRTALADRYAIERELGRSGMAPSIASVTDFVAALTGKTCRTACGCSS